MMRPNPSLVRVAAKIVMVRDSSLDTSLRSGRGRIIIEPLVATAVGVRIEEIIFRSMRAAAERLVGHDRAFRADVERDSVVGIAGDVPGENVVKRRRPDPGASSANRPKIRASQVDTDVAVGLS